MSQDAGTPMPTTKFAFPFPPLGAAGPGNSPNQAARAQTYYDALARAEDGFYPIGLNGQWHGGIHFDSRTGSVLNQDDGVHCIADGEIIAWKVDDEYPQVDYATCGAAKYSTGFVLVRHRLQLPKADRARAPAGASSDSTDATGDVVTASQQEPSLVFYSLYMHLMSWQEYQAHPGKARPAFWGDPVYVVGEKANDADRSRNPHIPEGGVGLNLRDAARGIVGFAPRDTRVRLGEPGTATGYYAVIQAVTGTLVPDGLSGAYAYRGELTTLPAEPSAKDEIVIPATPIPIAAGDLVGHLGQYQRYVDMDPLATACAGRSLVHVEVFTCEDINVFIQRSRARAHDLADHHRTLLLIDKGARLVQATGTDGPPTAGQLIAAKSADSGVEAGFARVVPIGELDDVVAEDDGTRWWQVEVGLANGASAWGWVRERDHANVRLCTPWDWPGFEPVEVDGTRPDQLYANQLTRQRQALPGEQQAVEARGEPAESGALFQKLHALMDVDGDGKVIASELRQALAKPWLAQAISHLIIEHESEWSGPMDKWSAIDDLIPAQRKQDWEKEKERIESLVWWRTAKGQHGLPSSEPLVIRTLHPVSIIKTFNARVPMITVGMLSQIFTAASAEHLQSIVSEINENIVSYKLDTALRTSHFFAQVREEIGNSARFTESLNYSPAGLSATFSYFARNPEEAQAYGRVDGRHADQEAIANRAYADRNGNGDLASGDGWRYKGRGLKMTTGRANYRDLRDSYHLVWEGEAPDFVADPDLLATARYAVQSAVFFWIRHNLYSIADRGPEDANVDAITRVINRHTSSYDERRAHFSRIWNATIFSPVGE